MKIIVVWMSEVEQIGDIASLFPTIEKAYFNAILQIISKNFVALREISPFNIFELKDGFFDSRSREGRIDARKSFTQNIRKKDIAIIGTRTFHLRTVRVLVSELVAKMLHKNLFIKVLVHLHNPIFDASHNAFLRLLVAIVFDPESRNSMLRSKTDLTLPRPQTVAPACLAVGAGRGLLAL